MTTPKKKWPHHAEWARIDTLAMAGKLKRLCNQIIYAEELDTLTTLQTVDRIKDGLNDIEVWMQNAREGIGSEQ